MNSFSLFSYAVLKRLGKHSRVRAPKRLEMIKLKLWGKRLEVKTFGKAASSCDWFGYIYISTLNILVKIKFI